MIQPLGHAFQKRVSLAWVPDDLQAFESLDIQGSDTLVSDLHKWLFDKVADKPIDKVCLDGFCYGAVQEAVDQFKKEAAREPLHLPNCTVSSWTSTTRIFSAMPWSACGPRPPRRNGKPSCYAAPVGPPVDPYLVPAAPSFHRANFG